MRKIYLVILAFMFVLIPTTTAFANDGVDGGTDASLPPISQPGQDPNDPDYWYDAEGVREYCLDVDPDLGCMYHVERGENGTYIIYFINNEGIRFRASVRGEPAEDGETPDSFSTEESPTGVFYIIWCADGA